MGRGLRIGFPRARRVSADFASYALTGQAATLTQAGGGGSLAFPGSVADQVFRQNVAGQSVDVDTLLASGAPAAGWASGGGFPTGLSLNTSTGVVSGTPTGAVGNYDVVITASDVSVADADWYQRSTASGVFYSNNFTYKDTAKTQLITNDADLRASAAQVGGTTTSNRWNTTQKLSGNGSLKMEMLANSENYGGWNLDFGGIAVSSKAVSKHQFYFQFAYYVDSTFFNLFPGVTASYGGKICIIECPNSSFDPGEVVIRRLPIPGGYMWGYLIDSAGVVKNFGLNTLSNTDAALNNFTDLGSPAVTNTATAQQRYGVNYNNKDDTTANSNYATSSTKFVSNGWFVFEVMVDQVNNVVKVWGAPYGSAPALIMGRMAANLPSVGTTDLGSNPQQLYTGVQLTNYPNTWTNYPTSDTFVGYDELIASDNPIRFPGGFDIPFTGTTTPTGYPPAGTTEQ